MREKKVNALQLKALQEKQAKQIARELTKGYMKLLSNVSVDSSNAIV